MMKTMASRQRGVSLGGLLIWVVVLIFVGISAMKIIPAYIQDAEIKGILQTIVRDPEMQSAAAGTIRSSFSKRAMMNNIKLVTAEDINVEKDSSGLLLSVSYAVKVPLAGNVSLLLEFNPSSAGK